MFISCTYKPYSINQIGSFSKGKLEGTPKLHLFAAAEIIKTHVQLLANTSIYEVFSFARINYSFTSFLSYSGGCVSVSEG